MADAGPLWGILWFALTIVGLPISIFATLFYVILQPFAACVEPAKDASESLLKLVQLPRMFAENMVHMKSAFGD